MRGRRNREWARCAIEPALILFCLFLLTCFSVGGIFSPAPAHALNVPPLKGYINDYAGMISSSAKAKIEAELKAFEQSDSTQVFILTVPGLQGDALEDYSIKVAEEWKIGQKGKDNGILLLVANQDRKIRIEVGRGLEGRLTDLTAGQIVDLVMKPRFKRGDFDGGFISGVSAIIDATRGEFKATQKSPAKKKGVSYSVIFTFIILGGIALVVLGSLSRTLGGLGGAVGLPALVYLGLFPVGIVPLIILALAGLGIGLLLPYLFSGSPFGGGMFWGGGNGSWGGGGGGNGGSDGGGGFDGGGGGDFGGGGASGDW